ncbi:hypothetical protein BN2537_2377 [Streptomyces venezuelae]|nr:hypothetical protein BN2537_2377 [Streptomyces venezuelae]
MVPSVAVAPFVGRGRGLGGRPVPGPAVRMVCLLGGRP